MQQRFVVETAELKPAELREWLAEQGCPAHLAAKVVENRARGVQPHSAPVVQPTAPASDLMSRIRAEAIL